MDSSIEGTITATIVNGNDTYVLKLENVNISPKPYKVTLNANGGVFVSEKESVGTKDIELTQDLDLTTLETVPTRTGYTLTGWYSDEACSEDKKVEQITIADVTSNLTLYAKWEPITTKMKFDCNYDPEDETARVVEKDIAYDSTTLETVTREDYTFSGWMNSDNNLVTDSTGTVLNQETFNQLILDSAKEGATEVTLYAKWTNLDVVFKTKVEDGDDQTFATIGVTAGETSVPITLSDIDENYTLEGWYLLNEDTQTKVLDSNGNIVNDVEGYIQDGKFIKSENESITLYAKWIQKKQAYVLADSFENGKSYILATSNDGLGKAMNSSFTGTNVTISTDRNSQKYIETDESNILWTYNNQYLQINGKYLYGYIDNDWDWNYKLKLNSTYSQWNYSDHKLSTSYYLSKRYGNQDVYIYYSGSSFRATNRYYSYYEYTSDFYLYTLGDIEVETFEYVNSIDTQNEEDNANEEVTLETQDESSYALVDDLTVIDEEVPTESEAPVSTEETYTEEITEEENTEVEQEITEEVQEITESE